MMLVLDDGLCEVMAIEGSLLGLLLGSFIRILLGLEEVGIDVIDLVVMGRKLGGAVGYTKIIWLDKTIERCV
jgi:hypothetical protein